MKRTISGGLALVILAGCAGTGAGYRPMVDAQNSPMARYETDLADCQAYARQVAGAAESAAAGAVAGAIFGALLSAAAGSRYSNTASARVGAVAGAAGGAAHGETDQRSVIIRCMSGRGYNVLR